MANVLLRRFALILPLLALAGGLLAVACGGGGEEEQPGERITDPARVPSSTPIQNPALYKILGNEVTLQGGGSGQVTPFATNTPVTSQYEVKSGDFCSTIAATHNITLEQLLAANRNIDCNNLKIGDRLKIPSATASSTPTRGPLTSNPTTTGGGGRKTYTVKAGDTCDGIARANSVTLQAFLSANSSIDANCTNLKEGQVVNIP